MTDIVTKWIRKNKPMEDGLFDVAIPKVAIDSLQIAYKINL